ncbi:MAG TPA: carboxynorspermidine decarboxylase [Bryobacteraceae bacterium]|nr:carboxynorspermidine decarboxylase [Bryobacteraceae bacterium]
MLTADKPIQELIEEYRMSLKTPYYLIDEARLLNNLEKIALLRERSGVKSVLALKCFSTWAVFDLLSGYLDGTTSSSVYEARLGHEKFGKEVHAYSVAFSDEDMDSVLPYATKLIFNSVSQLKRFCARANGIPVGLRINPGVSYSHFDLADPARRYCRLGASDRREIDSVAHLLKGLMFHCNCENSSFDEFSSILDRIGRNFGPLLMKVDWVSLGGGISFTMDDYPFELFCEKLAQFASRYGVQIYLEPGEAVVARSGFLVTTVLDIVHNEADVAIVDAGVETHMLDLLIYRIEARIDLPKSGNYRYLLAGRTCLAGDIFGEYELSEKLEVGSLIPLADAAGYTMVKKNWFNGIQMPSIVVRRLNGRVEVIKEFGFQDYVNSLS